MCLACQMEGEWLAYLERLGREEPAQQKLRQDAATTVDAAASKPAVKPAPSSRFVCEEPPSE